MNRRGFLALTGAAVATAGCTEDTQYNPSGNNSSDNGDEGGGIEDVKITEHEMVREDAGTSYETVSVVGVAENTGDEQLSYVEIRARFYDGDGNMLDSSLDNINDLGPGQTWSFDVQMIGMGSDAAAVADYDIGVGSSF